MGCGRHCQRHSVRDDLKRKVGELEFELHKKVCDVMALDEAMITTAYQDLQLESKHVRRRSHAFGESNSPRIPHNVNFKRGRSSSMRSLSTALIIDIPDVLLRGSGLTSYHVFIIKV